MDGGQRGGLRHHRGARHGAPAAAATAPAPPSRRPCCPPPRARRLPAPQPAPLAAAAAQAAKTLGFTECTLAADGCAVTKAWKDLSAAEQRNTMCLLGVGERRWGRHVDKATDFHRNLVFTNDAVYDFHFRMGTSTQVAVDEYMARKHPPVPIGPETP